MSIHAPIPFEQFQQLPEDEQRQYISDLVKQHRKEIEQLVEHVSFLAGQLSISDLQKLIGTLEEKVCES